MVLGFAHLSPRAQDGTTFTLGDIDFFGVQGQNLSGVLDTLPLQPGQKLAPAQADNLRDAIRASVVSSFGKPPTDINFVCCDSPGRADVYIGLPGDSYAPLQYRPAPRGTITLPRAATGLDREYNAAWEAAVRRGNSAEDDRRGYALGKDPALRVVQLRARAYTLKHQEQIADVLQHSSNPEQRQAAATLLGYARHSSSQIASLANAADDPDETVRNNAIRALEVLSTAAPLRNFDASPFIRMLFSGSWTDRNKVSLLLMHLTAGRDPKLLSQLRSTAMGPLLDGASWHSPGHSFAFLVLLGRVGNIPEDTLTSLISSGAKDQIIAAARNRRP